MHGAVLPTRGILATLGVLASLAGGAVAAELAMLRPARTPPAATMAPPSPTPTPHSRPAASADAALRFILSRPLFTSGRRPPPDATTRPDALPRLAGIVATPSSTTAIFAGDRTGQRGAILLAGARIDGWTLSRITPHEVLLRRDDQELRLRPSYGARPDAPPPPPPAPDLRRVPVLGTKRVNPQLAW